MTAPTKPQSTQSEADRRATRRALLRPRWIVGHVLLIAAVVAFVSLGFWQLSRLSDRLARNEVVAARQAMPAVDLSEALQSVVLGADAGDELAHRRVTTSGVYDVSREVLIQSRSLLGEPGFHVVTPLRFDDRAVLVNRGFVPQRFDRPPVAAALPPDGVVALEGRVRASVEAPRIGPSDPAEGTLERVFWLNIPRLQVQMPYNLAPVSLELTSQTPAQAGPLPLLLPEPTLDEGPHRSYAIQWFSFVVIALVGYGFLVRRSLRLPGQGPQ